MSKRLETARRLLHTQEQMLKRAQSEAAVMTLALEAKQTSERNLIALMEKGDPVLTNALMHSHAAQLKRISGEKVQIKSQLLALQDEIIQHGLSIERAKRFLETLSYEERAAIEKKEQAHLSDQIASSANQSL